jgi:Tfp pilus assembly protein PilF
MKTLTALATCAALLVATAAWAVMGNEAQPLKAATGSKAKSHINEGIEHYGMGHWDVAKKHFAAGEQADPQSAEAHYDLALVLDKTGDHGGATAHFQKAHDLGKTNAAIHDSEILKKHLKM